MTEGLPSSPAPALPSLEAAHGIETLEAVEADEEAARRLGRIQARISLACGRVGRQPSEVTLVGASKTQPAEVLAAFQRAGLAVCGENRVQEALAKSRSLAELLPASGAPLRPPQSIAWHLIGPLQTNKVRQALDLFEVFHAIDRPKVAVALNAEAARRGVRVTALAEVNLGGEASKHGFSCADLAAALLPLARLSHLRISGLMAIPPQGEGADDARRWFRRLRELRDELALRPEWAGWPGLLSMGMSEDFEVAIEEGATHVRVGTALFGPR